MLFYDSPYYDSDSGCESDVDTDCDEELYYKSKTNLSKCKFTLMLVSSFSILLNTILWIWI